MFKSKYLKSNIIHAFVGIGALFGGMLGITDSSGSSFGMQASEALKNSPFNSFLIPGIFLFVVLGLGNLSVLLISKYKSKYQSYISGFFGIILCFWIIIQCYMLFTIHILHIIFFIIGVVQIVLALLQLKKEVKNV